MEITRMRELAITGIAFQRERLDAELRELIDEQQTELRQAKLLPAAMIEEPSRRKNGRAKVRRKVRASASGEKPCNTCGKTKPLSEFHKNHVYKDGHTNRCKDCLNARVRELRVQRTAEKSAPPRKKGYHPRKAKQSIDPHTLTVEPATTLLDPATADALTCRLCNSPCSSLERYRNHMRLVHKKETAA